MFPIDGQASGCGLGNQLHEALRPVCMQAPRFLDFGPRRGENPPANEEFLAAARGQRHIMMGPGGSDPKRLDRIGLFVEALFYAAVFSVAFYLFHVQAFSETYIAEFQGHLGLARIVAADPFGFAVPHPGFHWMILALSRLSSLSLEYSGIVVLSVFVVIIARMINRTLLVQLKGCFFEKRVLWIGASLLLMSAIYFPPISQNFYLGQGSANFWGVPTLIVVKPFVLASILLLVSLLNATERRSATGYALQLALSLLVSLIMKPSFMLGFLPVMGIWLLLKWRTSRGLLWLSVAAVAPSLLFLLFQYYRRYYTGPSAIILTWFGVWKLYSRHIVLSVLLGTAFPLTLSLFRFRAVLRNDYLKISWLLYGVTFLQFAFLAERDGFDNGNFSWGYNLALWVLFLFTAVEFFRWLAEEGEGSGAEKAKLVLVSVLFSLHLTSGAAYLIKQLTGGIYT
jgi:hypothetical protein